MDWRARRLAFRALLSGSECVHPASVFDPLSARIASEIGFECGMYAGSTASLTILGDPDLIVITLTEFAEQALRIGRAAPLPILVDADHGYGNALNARRTVQELETAGVAALTIEDTDLPRGFGTRTPRLTSIEEGVGKMRAALAAREDPSLCIVGRTIAMGLTSTEDAVARAVAYEATGVDAIFFVGLTTVEQLAAARAALRLPIILGGTPAALSDRAMLAAHGVRIALQGHQPIMAAAQAVHDTLRALRDGVRPADLPRVADGATMARLTREAEFGRWTTEWLSRG